MLSLRQEALLIISISTVFSCCCLCRLQPLASSAICLTAWLLLSNATLQQLLCHPGSGRRVLCFGVSSSMAALSTSKLLLLIWRPWFALHDKARSVTSCAARGQVKSIFLGWRLTFAQNESAVSALQPAYAPPSIPQL